MYGTSMRENREIPPSPRLLITGWAAQGTQGGTPEMHERGKSDRFVVPANPPNKATAAEVGEERERAKGNTDGKTHPGPSEVISARSQRSQVFPQAEAGSLTSAPSAVSPDWLACPRAGHGGCASDPRIFLLR